MTAVMSAHEFISLICLGHNIYIYIYIIKTSNLYRSTNMDFSTEIVDILVQHQSSDSRDGWPCNHCEDRGSTATCMSCGNYQD